MTFQDTANLARDAEFNARLGAALTVEALAKPPDYLVDQILKSPGVGSAWFMPLVSASPTFDTQYATGGQLAIDDNEVLSSIQASWQRVFDLYEEVTP
jgi:hypothetical protein